MKEIQPHQQDKTVIEKQAEQHVKENLLVGSLKVIKGTKLYEFNLETQEIKEVNLETPLKYAFNKNRFSPARFKTEYNPKALYIRAINIKNAIRKLKLRLPNINPITKPNGKPNI